MPFTFAHPAAVLPLKYFPQRWRSMTGLIIGSMAPDFEKFFRMNMNDAYSHTWKSIFYFNIPVGLALAFLFHLVVRDVLIEHLPHFLQKRLIKLKGFDWVGYFRNHFGIVLLSVLIGAAFHIGCDAFTHTDGRFVRMLPILNGETVVAGYKTKTVNLLQNGSSVLGLLVIVFALLKLPALPVPSTVGIRYSKLSYWAVYFLITVAITILRYVAGYAHIADLMVSIISAGLISLVLTSLIFRRGNLLSRKRGTQVKEQEKPVLGS